VSYLQLESIRSCSLQLYGKQQPSEVWNKKKMSKNLDEQKKILKISRGGGLKLQQCRELNN